MRRAGSECGLIEKLMTVFHGGELSEHLMRSVMVVLILVAFKLQIERADIQVFAVEQIKFVAAGAIVALDAPVQFGRLSNWFQLPTD